MQSQPNKKSINDDYPFLSGGGEMGELTRSYEWAKTSLGHPANWPNSLQTTLSIVLNSKFPMFLWWGEDLIQFYNDAYRPSLGNGGKHPVALGLKAEDTWQEIWHIIKPLIDQVLGGGEATYSEDQLIPIYRNGTMEDVYWTFGYMPVKNETGKIEGVLVVCTENTEKIKLYQRVEESRSQLEFAIEATELGTWDHDPVTNMFTANQRLKKWFGVKTEDKIDLKDALNAVAPEDRQRLNDAIQYALRFESGGLYDIVYTLVHPQTGERRHVHAKGKAWFNENKKPYRFNGTLQDITDQKNAELSVKQSEEQFRNLANTIPQMAWITDADGYIYWYNQRWYDYTGTTLEEMQGWGWQKVHHPDLVDDVTEKFKKSIKDGKLYEQTFLLRSKKGQYRWFLTRATPIRDKNGVVQQWFGTNTDVTEQRRVEEALKESENKFRSLAETLPLLIWMTDAKGNAIYTSRSWEVYSGFNPDAEGSWNAIVHEDDLGKTNSTWHHSLQKGVSYHSELRLRNKRGDYRWHVVEGVPIQNADKEIIYWIGAFTDIHEQKLKEQKKDEFISIASHEMKTPLTTAKGYLDLLLDSLDATNAVPLLYANKANLAVGRLNKLITELLDASKIQHGKLNYNIAKFDFNEMLTEAIEHLQHGSRDYHVETMGTVSEVVTGDRERLQQVVTNLLSNAIKYSPGKNQVKITVTENHEQIQVAVQDFGVGIPERHLQNLFEKYYRVQEHSARFQGLGIGLYVSNEIISRHRGKMWIKSKEGEGSTFYFTLPK